MPLTVEALSSPPTLQDVGAGWGPYYSKGQSSALAPSPIIISLPACRVPRRELNSTQSYGGMFL